MKMNIVKQIAMTGLGLVFTSTAIMAQSLADARKAVNAEQYQKARSMFNNLASTQPKNAENFFYYGDLFLRLNKPDSAKIQFNKGLAADPEFKINYVGLGAVDLFAKNEAAAKSNFDKATAGMRKKDFKEYIYIGEAYTYENSRNLPKAYEWLAKAKENALKEPEYFMALGNAYISENKSSEAVSAFQDAFALDPNLLIAEVKIGEIWTKAFNFELAETTLKGVIAKDPNYGPAHRALAENSYRWASNFPNKRAELLPKAKEQYSKYLDLTDRSAESQYRYLIFLYNAADFVTLEKEASAFIAKYGKNKEYALANRFYGYAAIQNGNTDAGLKALDTFIKGVDPKRLIANDYVFLGKAYQASKQDSLAIFNFQEAFKLDSTNAEVLANIAKGFYAQKKFAEAAKYYELVTKAPKSTLQDYFNLGMSHYFSFATLTNANSTDTAAINNALVKADSAFTYVAVKANNSDAYLYKGRVERYIDKNDVLGKGVEPYNKYIELVTAKPAPTDREKTNLVEAYSFLGVYYIKTDKTKSTDYFNKALALDPNNKQVKEALAAIKSSK